MGTRLVSDEEYNRVFRLEQKGDFDGLLQELWRFRQTQGEFIFTEGEVERGSYRAGYHSDNMTFGNRIYGLPSESLEKKFGSWFEELHNRVTNLHPKK